MQTEKPASIGVNAEAIPQEIKALPQWCLWRWERRNGKLTKPPYQIDETPAKSNNPKTWAKFDSVLDAYRKGQGDGIGFMLTPPYCGLDLDDCRGADGKFEDWAASILDSFHSYSEVSPSGKGAKILLKGALPKGGHHNEKIGVFQNNRYFCITGNAVNGNAVIRECQTELDNLIRREWPEDFGKRKPRAPGNTHPGLNKSDLKIYEKARKARNGSKFIRLWKGDWSEEYPSQSEADAALCSMLAFWTQDVDQIDRLFRSSRLYRDKWERQDYRARTLSIALGDHRQTTPRLSLDVEISTNEVITAAFEGQKGAAKLFIRLNIGKISFDHAAGRWYLWKEHVWVEDHHGEPLSALDRVQTLFVSARAYCSGEIVTIGEKLKNTTDKGEETRLKAELKSLEEQEKACATQIKSLNALGYRKAVVEFSAQGTGSLGISGTEWDQKPWLLPCANGVVDLHTGNLGPGDPRDYLKTAAPTTYDPQAKCPRWESALSDIFRGDRELILFIQRVLGMALVGDAIEHVLIVFFGTGRNGKDTILSVIAFVLGPLAGPVQSELLLEQGRLRSSSAPSADIMALRGRRVAWANETNEGRKMDAGRVKSLTGGGFLVGRAPFGRLEISFPQSYTLFLLTNARPHAPADDYALWKRLHLVPFEVGFVENPQLPNER
ncbi:MAG: hypothetical protein JXB23_11370, partial [Candidatus Aminicenantes bacterium]|nr:hypothetical protein [Candidatus Aminicenantes bacterium]